MEDDEGAGSFIFTVDCNNLPMGMIRRADNTCYTPVRGVCSACFRKYPMAMYMDMIHCKPLNEKFFRNFQHMKCDVAAKDCLKPPPMNVSPRPSFLPPRKGMLAEPDYDSEDLPSSHARVVLDGDDSVSDEE